MNKEDKICVFCRNDITGEDFKTVEVDDDVKEVLAVVLFKVNWNKGDKVSYLCGPCSSKLFEAFEFKTVCLYVENKIVLHISLEEPQVDLKEIYLKQHDEKQSVKIEDDQKICRLCLELVNKFVPYEEVDADIIRTCIPEVKFSFTKDPVICTSCLGSLRTHSDFIKNCLDVHKRGLNAIEMVAIKSEVNVEEGPHYKSEEPDMVFEENELEC